MKLKDFVSNSISEIIDGIADAQNKTESSGAIINPRGKAINSESISGFIEDDERQRTPIVKLKYNVVVEADDSESDKAGISVVGGIFGIGGAIENKNANRLTNSIAFSIPILFPIGNPIKK